MGKQEKKWRKTDRTDVTKATPEAMDVHLEAGAMNKFQIPSLEFPGSMVRQGLRSRTGF